LLGGSTAQNVRNRVESRYSEIKGGRLGAAAKFVSDLTKSSSDRGKCKDDDRYCEYL
jgi:RNA polymerase-interacting CarD/CdnL/TRCF family regulator